MMSRPERASWSSIHRGVIQGLLVALCVGYVGGSSYASPSRSSVIFILADDLGWGDLSCYGSRQIDTPNLDRLAREGVRFTQAYVASPICSASRTGFMTGSFPAHWKITSYLQTRAGNAYCEQANWLDTQAPYVARAFKAAGYATGHFGKWHMGGGRDVQDAPLPSAYGFDESHVNFEGMGPRFDSALQGTADGKPIPRHRMTEYWTDRAVDFIRRHPDTPFYVDLWPQDTHTPHTPEPAQLERMSPAIPGPERRFRTVLKELDVQVGRLLAALKELGRDQETIVVFAGDNGPEPTFGRVRSGGLRGMKWSLYEGGIRVPLIVRAPALLPAGQVNDTTVISAVDYFPTLAALCHVEVPAGARFDGEDLSAALRGRSLARSRPLFWEYGRKPPEPGAKGLARSPTRASRSHGRRMSRFVTVGGSCS